MSTSADPSVRPQQPPALPAATLLHAIDYETQTCKCPSCQLGSYMGEVYGTQHRATAAVMQELPSACFEPGQQHSVGGGMHHSLHRPPTSATQRLQVCPMYETFGWCLYGRTCLLPHSDGGAPPHVALPTSLEAAVAQLMAKCSLHYDDVYSCDVCGYENITEGCTTKVGEVYTYRYCPNCTSMCYFPQLLHVVEAIVDEVGDDYNLYKDTVDRIRKQLPDLLKIPLTYESHRIATTIFAWSLVSPIDARDAVNAASKVLPDMNAIVSLGSGTGYVEHVFNRVVNGIPAVPNGPRQGISSFDNVLASVYPHKRISFFAFDEIIRPVRYSVRVCVGMPTVLLSIDCSKAVLLLSWPPFGSPSEEQSSMGFEGLRNFVHAGGKVLIYVGDTASTGDWRFHEFLFNNFALVKDYKVRREVRRWNPQDMGLIYAGNDTIGVYERRPAPLAAIPWQWQRM